MAIERVRTWQSDPAILAAIVAVAAIVCGSVFYGLSARNEVLALKNKLDSEMLARIALSDSLRTEWRAHSTTRQRLRTAEAEVVQASEATADEASKIQTEFENQIAVAQSNAVRISRERDQALRLLGDTRVEMGYLRERMQFLDDSVWAVVRVTNKTKTRITFTFTDADGPRQLAFGPNEEYRLTARGRIFSVAWADKRSAVCGYATMGRRPADSEKTLAPINMFYENGNTITIGCTTSDGSG